MQRAYIIAEAGVNHNGDLKAAFDLVKAAAEAGADAVKFQTFKASKLVAAHAKMAEYQIQNTQKEESQLAMLERLELSFEDHHKLVLACKDMKIQFLSTAFDHESLNFLNNKIEMPLFKIPSGEITNGPLLLGFAQTGKDLVLSTGMSNLEEIHQALAVLSFGLLYPEKTPKSFDEVLNVYRSNEAKDVLKKKVKILHCTSEYPAPFDEINLNAMLAMKKEFNCPIGYSDHTEGISVPVAAVALGATVIEKHFTLDKNMEGPDHKASLEPHELKAMVKAIREVELALGDEVKTPGKSEHKNREIVRKSLWASQPIKKGDQFSSENVAVLRPASGVSPMSYWDFIGKTSDQNFQPGDKIS